MSCCPKISGMGQSTRDMLGWYLKNGISGLSLLSLRWINGIQSTICQKQLSKEIVFTQVFGKRIKSCVSSAYECKGTPHALMVPRSGFMYTLNSVGNSEESRVKAEALLQSSINEESYFACPFQLFLTLPDLCRGQRRWMIGRWVGESIQ